MLINTGNEPVQSKSGLLTTVCYKIGDQPPVYALEGSIAITGALVQWLRDNLGHDQGGARDRGARQDGRRQRRRVLRAGVLRPVRAVLEVDARGVIAGLTRYVNAGHIARAALEATAFQTREVVDAMRRRLRRRRSTRSRSTAAWSHNDLLMQFQADILGVPVVRPEVAETTALGAAYAAGLAVGFWNNQEDLRANWAEDKRWEPQMDDDTARRQLQACGRRPSPGPSTGSSDRCELSCVGRAAPVAASQRLRL